MSSFQSREKMVLFLRQTSVKRRELFEQPVKIPMILILTLPYTILPICCMTLTPNQFIFLYVCDKTIKTSHDLRWSNFFHFSTSIRQRNVVNRSPVSKRYAYSLQVCRWVTFNVVPLRNYIIQRCRYRDNGQQLCKWYLKSSIPTILHNHINVIIVCGFTALSICHRLGVLWHLLW